MGTELRLLSGIECGHPLRLVAACSLLVGQDEEITGAAAARMFCFCAYIAIAADETGGQLETIARNDYEDAQVLRHVDLAQPMILVTEDRKMRERVQSALRLAADLQDFAEHRVHVSDLVSLSRYVQAVVRV